MPNHSVGIHHHIKRKQKRKESFLENSFTKQFIDRAIYFVGFFGPIMTLPQLSKIWLEKNAEGVSAVSWGAYIIVAIFWVLYGLIHKEKPLVVISLVWIVLEFMIVTGTLMYG
ncbi:MAG: hypothetical protein COV59_02295 [Candidatus Magasanikbacteria bacterium CG11_big_fil_rev_8_21_14_0_20_39_34]|uniref:MtN3 and saliva related transmembrane protein n=1 Tax=Candidatus Magasanikbacteria bacterium CG11_big_fil_rev_8_21_14_0_20_39_34 TaxID=1974653 RepID=A0A2H0N526_9BACT|nr:MAG: hypothetical protein COV59_02295 [Candidatus Magasanikbacteria bacterium CG11_big_fil_rev_8_21_14_0_20_39_34]